eukprot:41447_1
MGLIKNSPKIRATEHLDNMNPFLSEYIDLWKKQPPDSNDGFPPAPYIKDILLGIAKKNGREIPERRDIREFYEKLFGALSDSDMECLRDELRLRREAYREAFIDVSSICYSIYEKLPQSCTAAKNKLDVNTLLEESLAMGQVSLDSTQPFTNKLFTLMPLLPWMDEIQCRRFIDVVLLIPNHGDLSIDDMFVVDRLRSVVQCVFCSWMPDEVPVLMQVLCEALLSVANETQCFFTDLLHEIIKSAYHFKENPRPALTSYAMKCSQAALQTWINWINKMGSKLPPGNQRGSAYTKSIEFILTELVFFLYRHHFSEAVDTIRLAILTGRYDFGFDKDFEGILEHFDLPMLNTDPGVIYGERFYDADHPPNWSQKKFSKIRAKRRCHTFGSCSRAKKYRDFAEKENRKRRTMGPEAYKAQESAHKRAVTRANRLAEELSCRVAKDGFLETFQDIEFTRTFRPPWFDTRTCSFCGRVMRRALAKKCNRCHVPRYCGRACQKRHWREHKKVCVEC